MSETKRKPTEAEQLRELIHEAHEAIKDLTHIRREIERLVSATMETIQVRMEHAAEVQIAALMAATEEAITKTDERIHKRFDQVADLLLGEDKKSKKAGKPSLEEVARVVTYIQTTTES